jgi:hypothetical protein
MTTTKNQKTKLPVSVTLPPVHTEPKRELTALQVGPITAFVRSFIQQVDKLKRAIGAYETFVFVMIITGIVGVLYAKDPWPIVSLVVSGLIAALISRIVPPKGP